MTFPELDDDGYPTEETLAHIRKWPVTDLHGLFDYISWAWCYPQFWEEEAVPGFRMIQCSTGGWSGNEDLIGALQENSVAWLLSWYQSTRGGHFVFKLGHK